jgi:hypothetical protein
VVHAVEQLGVLVDEPGSALQPARLLVGEHAEDDVAGRLAGSRTQERLRHHRHRPFHVERAAPPQHAVADLSAEGRQAPALALGRDDVHVALEQERRRLAPALDAGDQVRPVGRRGIEPALDTCSLEQAGEVTDAIGFGARRVDGVEADQIARDLEDFHILSLSRLVPAAARRPRLARDAAAAAGRLR